MIVSRLALLFALAAAVAVPAASADASPPRSSRRRLGEFQDEEDLAAAVQGDQELGDNANVVLVEPAVRADHHGGSGGGGKGSSGGSSKDACKSGDSDITCDTDYEVFAVGSAASHGDRSAACALVGEGWGLCTLEQLCPSNPDATATEPTLPATQLFYSVKTVSGSRNKGTSSVAVGVSLFSDDQWVAISSPSGSCASGAWAQLGTRSAMADLCKSNSQVDDYCPDPAGEDGNTANAICCGCASTRARGSPAVEHSYECPTGTDAPTKSPTGPPVDVDPGLTTQSPTRSPSGNPSGNPSDTPSGNPSDNPSGNPTTQSPTRSPSGNPSDIPSGIPTAAGAGGAACEPVTYDGVTYGATQIGDQCWTTQNLRTTKYADGTLIKEGNTTDVGFGVDDGPNPVWTGNTDGAQVVYLNNGANPEDDSCASCQTLCWYGRLYNWYAVNNTAGLCPQGWRVPSDQDWTDLVTYVSLYNDEEFSGKEALALKGDQGCHWAGNAANPTLLGTNDFGLTIVGQGFRTSGGTWSNTGATVGRYWTSTENKNHPAIQVLGPLAFTREFNYDDNLVGKFSAGLGGSISVKFGLYVRCMKDAP